MQFALARRLHWFGICVFFAGCGDNLASRPRSADLPIDSGVAVDARKCDAQEAELSCLCDPIPGPEGPSLTVSGRVYTLESDGSELVIPDATLEVFRTRNTAIPIARAFSALDGQYTATVGTDNMLLDAYIQATQSQYMDSYIFPATPFYQQTVNNADAMLLSTAQIDYFAQLVGVTQDAANGVHIVRVIGCGGQPLAGATVSASPAAGHIAYSQNGSGSAIVPDGDASMTDASGIAVLFNVPEGDVVIGAQFGEYLLREHTVFSIAGALTSTAVQP